MRAQRFKFLQDNDSHWYLIPVEQEQAFESWVTYMAGEPDQEEAGEIEYQFQDYRFEDRRISGPVEAFTFTDPKED